MYSLRKTAIALSALAVAMFVIGPAAIAKEKIKIEKLDDLPRHTYTIGSKPSEIIMSDAIAALMADVKRDVLETLDTYEIDDNNTIQGFYATLQGIAYLEHDFDKAIGYSDKIKELEDKEAAKYTTGMVGRSYADALKTSQDPTSDEFKSAFQGSLKARIESMPWDVVQETIQQMNGQMQILSENLLVGMVEGGMDGAVEKAGFVSGDQARQLINLRVAMEYIIPYKNEISSVLGAQIASHKVDKDNIWPARDITFTGDEGYSPVVVGVWDSGVDTDVFKGHNYTNAKEKYDGHDTDGNGFVDDVHGIAYDLEMQKTSSLLYDLGDWEADRKQLEDQLKGFMDLQAAIDSPEAAELRKTLSTLEKDEVKPFIESLSLYSVHAHGTHVAGIAIEGNPYANVLTSRLSFDHHMTPMPYTTQLCEDFGKSFVETVQYLKDHDVRVVNMSWGLSVEEIEGNLASNGIGETAEERAEMARGMFEICKADLYNAMKNAPDILFVAAAGNSDNDVEFDEFIPSGFDLPNVLISGAVDQAGEPTSFTSFGGTVTVYSNGFEVDSYVPGGRRLKLSGTSMASPNVANLAAKLVAKDPTLTPHDVIQLIEDGADDFGTDDPMLVINPKKSLELLAKRTAKTSG